MPFQEILNPGASSKKTPFFCFKHESGSTSSSSLFHFGRGHGPRPLLLRVRSAQTSRADPFRWGAEVNPTNGLRRSVFCVTVPVQHDMSPVRLLHRGIDVDVLGILKTAFATAF